MTNGVKYDQGKAPLDRLGLVPTAVGALAQVLDYGAKKYPEADNWKRVQPFRSRYIAAAMRHVLALALGEDTDESGLPHAAHAMACLAFLIEGPGAATGRPKPGDRVRAIGNSLRAAACFVGQIGTVNDNTDPNVPCPDAVCVDFGQSDREKSWWYLPKDLEIVP